MAGQAGLAPLAVRQRVPEERAGEQDRQELARVHDGREQQRAVRADRVHDEQLACAPGPSAPNATCIATSSLTCTG